MPEFITGTLAELNNHYAKKQSKLLENLTEDTAVLNQMKFEPASHGLWNAYEEVTAIKGAGFVDMNAPLPQLGVDTKLKKQDLSIMGGEIFVPEDTAKMWGSAEAYFAKRTPALLKEAGMTAEQKLIYNNIAKFAKDNSKLQSAGGTAAASGDTGLYSMYAFRQIEGENIGLYSPEGFKNGAGLDVAKINGGNLYKNTNGVLGYGIRLKGYFGFQLANAKGVAGIVNINAAHIPTAAQIDDMLIQARATAANTFIICHPKVLSMLNTYKGNVLQMTTGDQDLNRTYMAWNGIRFVTSYNFIAGNEKQVSV
ncbi:MAG: hypothetical protein J6S85_02035 [Methanobrevibacter sp.]|nr:hypothetical protein [Methanobrevibacter sp.]